MKKVMIKCVLTIGLFVGLLSNVSANPNLPAVEIIKADYEKKISFEAKGVEGMAKVSLLDEAGVSLYAQSWTNQSEVARIFDLEQLPSGQYTLVFETEQSEVVQPFSIAKRKIQLNAADRIVRMIPLIEKENQYIKVSWSTDQNADVEITIDDPSGEPVMEEELQGVLKVARRYDVSRLKSGSYLVKVKTKTKTYYQEISW